MAREKLEPQCDKLFPHQTKHHHDIIILGLQECKHMHQKTVSRQVTAHLKARGYVMFAFQSMWEIVIFGFVKSELVSFLSNPEVRSYRDGALGGLVGNKGGI